MTKIGVSNPLLKVSKPRLVGTFLLHSCVFRDGLLSRVIEDLAGVESTDVSLYDVFIHSVSSSICYLSNYEIAALNSLRLVDESTAATAVFIHFLSEIAKLWAFSPYFSRSGFSLLEDLHRHSTDPSFYCPLLNAFSPLIALELPRISELRFYNGIAVSVTSLDVLIMSHLLGDRLFNSDRYTPLSEGRVASCAHRKAHVWPDCLPPRPKVGS
jgi:hypothetical protein